VPWLFPRADGRELGQFHKTWKRACREAGCPSRLVHDLRRRAVKRLVDAGIPEKVAMTVTGHRTRTVFDRYHIVSEVDVRKAVQRLAAHDD
jgi:integrase